jgi:RHS repeat-associated protein
MTMVFGREKSFRLGESSFPIHEDFSLGLKNRTKYKYDVFDRLISKDVTVGGSTHERYIYDGQNLVLVLNPSGEVQDRYLNGAAVDQVLAEEDAAGTVSWMLADNQGSVRDVAVYDAVLQQTDITDHIDYDAFGNIASQTHSDAQPRFTYAGRLYDAAAGLYYYRSRWYDARTGRFISEDPSGFAGGDVNLNRYVDNSPMNGTDPSGQAAMEMLGGGDAMGGDEMDGDGGDGVTVGCGCGGYGVLVADLNVGCAAVNLNDGTIDVQYVYNCGHEVFLIPLCGGGGAGGSGPMGDMGWDGRGPSGGNGASGNQTGGLDSEGPTLSGFPEPYNPFQVKGPWGGGQFGGSGLFPIPLAPTLGSGEAAAGAGGILIGGAAVGIAAAPEAGVCAAAISGLPLQVLPTWLVAWMVMHDVNGEQVGAFFAATCGPHEGTPPPDPTNLGDVAGTFCAWAQDQVTDQGGDSPGSEPSGPSVGPWSPPPETPSNPWRYPPHLVPDPDPLLEPDVTEQYEVVTW